MAHKGIPLTLSILLLVACANPDPDAAARRAWTAQLAAMQQEIQALRAELAQVRQAVTELHRQALRPAAAPPPVARPRLVPKLDLAGQPSRGRADAPIAIVEFSDYECPFCRRHFSQTFARIQREYVDTGKLRYVFRDFPLAFHANAKGAAVAAHCAGQQQAFWKMHAALFAQQHALNERTYHALAQQLGLKLRKFKTCLRDPAQQQAIEADLAAGQAIGVQGTPHFLIGRVVDGVLVNAQVLSGALPYSAFTAAIDRTTQVARR